MLFLGSLLITSLAGWILARLLESAGLSGVDQLAGLFFGLLRGVLIITAMVYVAGMTPLTQDPWWKESRLLPTFQSLGHWLRDQLPPDYNHYLKFSLPNQP